MGRYALFEGLIVTEEGVPVEVVYVGADACYAIPDPDAGFVWNVDAERVDRQVLGMLREEILRHRELVTEGMLRLLQQDDLFTKAMIDASIESMEDRFDELIRTGLPEEARAWLGWVGFRVVVNVHGEVVRLEYPGMFDEGDG